MRITMNIGSRSLALAVGLAGSVCAPLHAGEQGTVEEIIVTGSHLPLSLARTGSSVTVISSEQIRYRAPLLVSDMLRDVPGFAVGRNGVLGSSTQVRVRGAEGNHLLVLIDGVEANDPSQGDEFNWGTLTADSVERIEILRGPQSALVGSDAVAGVVNIITRSATQPLSVSAFAEGGSFGTRQAGLSAGHRGASADIRIGVSTLDSDGENISREGGEDDGYRNNTFNVKGGWSPTRDLRVGVVARRSDGRSDFDTVSFLSGLPADTNAYSDFRGDTARVYADYAMHGGLFRHRLEYAYTGWDNDSFEDGLSTGTTRNDKDQYRYVGSLQWADRAQQVSLLLERESEDFSQRGDAQPWGDPNQDRSRDTDSVGVEYRGTFAQTLTLAASARHDDNSEFDASDAWRLEAVYSIEGSGTRLRAAWGTAVKNPTFSERFGYYTNFQGNPGLQPEESESAEVGVEQHWRDGRISASLTLFRADLADEIDGFVFDPVSFAYTARNKDGKSRREGLEIALRAALGPALSLAGSYTYTDSTAPDASGKDADELRRAPHIGSLTLAWQARDDLQLNLNAQYNGSQDDQYFPPWPDASRIVRMDDYTLLNLNATFGISDTMEVYARGENLLDEDYEEVFGYRAPGIGGYLGLRYHLQ
jgi:vitamin B12 transporter